MQKVKNTIISTYYLFRLQTDIHLGSEEWDRALSGEHWEPETIVAKVPEFLQLVREVQNFINGSCKNENESAEC